MDSDTQVNVLPAEEANPRYFNVTDFPPEKLEVTIDHKRTVRVQGEHLTNCFHTGDSKSVDQTVKIRVQTKNPPNLRLFIRGGLVCQKIRKSWVA